MTIIVGDAYKGDSPVAFLQPGCVFKTDRDLGVLSRMQTEGDRPTAFPRVRNVGIPFRRKPLTTVWQRWTMCTGRRKQAARIIMGLGKAYQE